MNLSFLCNLTETRIKELIHINKNSDQAGDATWILTSAFIIFTMQSGFGLLEAGNVSSKNECNIMVKNAVDVIFGGLGYWMCGFAFSFGEHPEYSNAFCGFGNFFTDTEAGDDSGILFAKYFFQLSFATTATTIVSGAMAERTNLKAYMFFSFINFLSYVFPAHWIWADNGFLKQLGVVDVAGCGPVHVVGGTSAIVASIMLKPRAGIFDKDSGSAIMASPTNVVLGTFMLWWGWLGFNCGSTFGVSGGKWKLASRAAVTTVNSSVGGGLWAVFYCFYVSKKYKGKLDIGVFTNCILGGLVSITAICAICKPWEALLIGIFGGFIVSTGIKLIAYLRVDDPVSCIPVHCFCGVWGLLCVGLFGDKDNLEGVSNTPGIVKGGPFSFFGFQCLAALSIGVWAGVSTALQLLLCDFMFGLRMSSVEEELGADASEHGIYPASMSGKQRSGSRTFGSVRVANHRDETDMTSDPQLSYNNSSADHKNNKPLQKRQISYRNDDIKFGYVTFRSVSDRQGGGVDNFGFSFGRATKTTTGTLADPTLSSMPSSSFSSSSSSSVNGNNTVSSKSLYNRESIKNFTLDRFSTKRKEVRRIKKNYARRKLQQHNNNTSANEKLPVPFIWTTPRLYVAEENTVRRNSVG